MSILAMRCWRAASHMWRLRKMMVVDRVKLQVMEMRMQAAALADRAIQAVASRLPRVVLNLMDNYPIMYRMAANKGSWVADNYKK